jgi:abhydrolase domain-containing protein 1/3
LESTLIYSRVLAHGAIRTFRQHKHKLTEWDININEHAIENAISIKTYDEHLTRVIFGFESADHYYSDAGCVQYIEGKEPHVPGLKIPMIFISSRDDPLIGEEVIPIALSEKHPNTLLILTKKGGHIGFNEGFWPAGKTWSDRLVLQLLDSIKNTIPKK